MLFRSIGIPPDKHAEVFEEFLQLGNPERDQRKGLGMGLAIAAGLARSLQAHITLASRPGRGSVFSLVLPLNLHLHGAMPTVSRPNLATALAHDRPLRSMNGLIVLVVDDEETVRAGLQAVLHGWGCTVLAADGLDDALVAVDQQRPDVLITDYRLRAGLTGGEVIEGVRARLGHKAGRDLPSIIITGDTHPERLIEAQSHGTLLLHKPIGADVLRHALQRALG